MPLSGKELLKRAKKKGWTLDRINGSHHQLKHPKSNHLLSIPVHANKDLGKGLEQKLLKKMEEIENDK